MIRYSPNRCHVNAPIQRPWDWDAIRSHSKQQIIQFASPSDHLVPFAEQVRDENRSIVWEMRMERPELLPNWTYSSVKVFVHQQIQSNLIQVSFFFWVLVLWVIFILGSERRTFYDLQISTAFVSYYQRIRKISISREPIAREKVRSKVNPL